MKLNEYQAKAARTVSAEQSTRDQRINFSLGLAGEVGELINIVKKWAYHGHNRDKVIDEAGDVLWYLSALCASFNLTLEEVAEHNLTKLQNRYPDGFSQEASIRRETVEE